MKQLKLGKMSSAEVAEWFGIAESTLRRTREERYEILQSYCEFTAIHGGIIVLDIHIDTYHGDLSKLDVKNYLEEIQLKGNNCLSSVAGMARKFKKEKSEYKDLKESTVVYRLSKAGEQAFGKNNIKQLATNYEGAYGSRSYVWAIKLGDYNEYRALTKEEEELFDKIILNCCKTEPEKTKTLALLEKQLKAEEITVKEYFETRELLGLDSFGECLFEFRNQTGLILTHCSEHELRQDSAFEQD